MISNLKTLRFYIQADVIMNEQVSAWGLKANVITLPHREVSKDFEDHGIPQL